MAETDWEGHYREGRTPWDKGAPSPALREFLAVEPIFGRILVPGCGLGHDVRALAAAHPEAWVVGLDIAPTAILAAKELGVPERVEFREGDLFSAGEAWNQAFDWVWEHTCFCAISPELRDAYVAAVHTVLRPGGRLAGVFYLDPYDGEHRPEHGRPPFGCGIEELKERFGPRFELDAGRVPARAYPGREGREWLVGMRRREESAKAREAE
jgi:SAM-dependent methyltransferase